MRQGNRTGGFTLIELLIVIAIIGILAAVLIPNLLTARQRAFDTAAQACAKEILVAAEIWAIDHPNVGYEGFEPAATGACAGLELGDVTINDEGTVISGTVTSRSGATVNYGNTVAISVTQQP